MTDQEPVAQPQVLVVPRSSFDFLEGRFRATAKLRTLNVITAGVLAVVVAAVLITALAGVLRVRFANEGLDRLTTEQAAVRSRLGGLQDTAGGATADEVATHVAERATQAATVLQNQADYTAVLQDILGLPGVVVESIRFDKAEGGTDIAAVSVTGSAPDPNTASDAVEALSDPARFPYLRKGADNIKAQCAGGADTGRSNRCTWGWRGVVTEAARGARGKQIETTFKVTPAAPPTPLPQAQPSGKD